MPTIDAVRDAACQYVVDNVDRIVLCSQEPTTYAQATDLVGGSPAGYCLGEKTSPTITVADHSPDGRRAQCAGFTDGAILASGGGSSGMWWAAVDDTGDRIIAKAEITGDQAVVVGSGTNTWSLATAFAVVAIRD